LLTVDCLGEGAVEEGIFNIKLVDRPVRGDGERKVNADGARFDDGAESFVVVDAVFLREAADNPSSLVTC
jgi:hypothetical protein